MGCKNKITEKSQVVWIEFPNKHRHCTKSTSAKSRKAESELQKKQIRTRDRLEITQKQEKKIEMNIIRVVIRDTERIIHTDLVCRNVGVICWCSQQRAWNELNKGKRIQR